MQYAAMNNFDRFDEDRYWFAVMGEPSATGPWGWQVDGPTSSSTTSSWGIRWS
ncbi:MAG: hypothetical protein KC442_13800 [Thermomicrobiales bacterium]|nr:hypothetical protein [Thermomicrobiales bacterium]